jgi:hypothetical protein
LPFRVAATASDVGRHRGLSAAATTAIRSEDVMHMIVELGYWLSIACTVIWGS